MLTILRSKSTPAFYHATLYPDKLQTVQKTGELDSIVPSIDTDIFTLEFTT
jgi:hypothetical protein